MGQKIYYQSNTFTIHIYQTSQKTYLTMRMFTPHINTESIPETTAFLDKFYPQVLQTECFNDGGRQFSHEVKETEVGHLFEHILIEKIYQCQKGLENQKIAVNGHTRWNWRNEPRGTFHIRIDRGSFDYLDVISCLDETICLIEQLLKLTTTETRQRQSSNMSLYPSYSNTILQKIES